MKKRMKKVTYGSVGNATVEDEEGTCYEELSLLVGTHFASFDDIFGDFKGKHVKVTIEELIK